MNDVEAWKAEKHGFDVWGDLEAYARRRTPMAEIGVTDLERMKWYGIFPWRGSTDDAYMIRIRVPGCELSASQARALAEVARRVAGTVGVTRRGDVQVAGLRIEELPEILARLEGEGLTGRQTGHDNVRNVMTPPWAGLDPEELVDVRPLCRSLTEVFLGDRRLSDLPRRFTVAVDGRTIPAAYCWTQDTSFVAAIRCDGSIAFRWLLAGRRCGASGRARALPVWVGQDRAPEVLRQTLNVYRELGCRDDRARAWLRDLVGALGAGEFLRRVEDRLGVPLERCEEAGPAARAQGRLLDWFEQKQPGCWALGVPLSPRDLTHRRLDGLADLAESFGDGNLRTAGGMGMVVTGIPAHRRPTCLQALGRLGLAAGMPAAEARCVRRHGPDRPMPPHVAESPAPALQPVAGGEG